jgi:hypothetical protein
LLENILVTGRYAMGKTQLSGYNQDPLKVTGILARRPENTDLQFKVVIRFGTALLPNIQDQPTGMVRAQVMRCYVVAAGKCFGCFVQRTIESFCKKKMKSTAK